jgi:hypothetical protein
LVGFGLIGVGQTWNAVLFDHKWRANGTTPGIFIIVVVIIVIIVVIIAVIIAVIAVIIVVIIVVIVTICAAVIIVDRIGVEGEGTLRTYITRFRVACPATLTDTIRSTTMRGRIRTRSDHDATTAR